MIDQRILAAAQVAADSIEQDTSIRALHLSIDALTQRERRTPQYIRKLTNLCVEAFEKASRLGLEQITEYDPIKMVGYRQGYHDLLLHLRSRHLEIFRSHGGHDKDHELWSEKAQRECLAELERVLKSLLSTFDQQARVRTASTAGTTLEASTAHQDGEAPLENSNAEPTQSPPLVILVHGVNDDARWTGQLAKVLSDAGFKVEPTNFGNFGIPDFFLSAKKRKEAKDELQSQIVSLFEHHKDNTRISVIAHSFGTHLLLQIIDELQHLRFFRIIFCGSVVRAHGVDFRAVSDAAIGRGGSILNEVGDRDIWPAVAENLAPNLFGAAGTVGIRKFGIRDRWWTKAPHHYYLNPDFCRNYWVDYLKGDEANGEFPSDPNSPWWIWALRRFRLIWLLKIAAAAAALIWVFLMYWPASPTMPRNGWAFAGYVSQEDHMKWTAANGSRFLLVDMSDASREWPFRIGDVVRPVDGTQRQVILDYSNTGKLRTLDSPTTVERGIIDYDRDGTGFSYDNSTDYEVQDVEAGAFAGADIALWLRLVPTSGR